MTRADGRKPISRDLKPVGEMGIVDIRIVRNRAYLGENCSYDTKCCDNLTAVQN